MYTFQLTLLPQTTVEGFSRQNRKKTLHLFTTTSAKEDARGRQNATHNYD
jgi:hypothetical protein